MMMPWADRFGLFVCLFKSEQKYCILSLYLVYSKSVLLRVP